MDKDYKAEYKQIRDHAGKNKAKSSLFQKFERKTILTREPIKEPPLSPTILTPTPSVPAFSTPAPSTLTSVGQKSKSNLPDGQEHPTLMVKDSEYQVPNPDIFPKKVVIV